MSTKSVLLSRKLGFQLSLLLALPLSLLLALLIAFLLAEREKEKAEKARFAANNGKNVGEKSVFDEEDKGIRIKAILYATIQVTIRNSVVKPKVPGKGCL
jgi:membrane protein implicated in regulation of membrane protease activity